jgi:hypothetical protein
MTPIIWRPLPRHEQPDMILTGPPKDERQRAAFQSLIESGDIFVEKVSPLKVWITQVERRVVTAGHEEGDISLEEFLR